jgi:cysteine-rich repeat protein
MCTVESGWSCSGTTSICTPIAVCGNGIVESGETCDDNNTVNGDGCSNTCKLETAVCGNGIVESGEACDDGNMLMAMVVTILVQFNLDGVVQAVQVFVLIHYLLGKFLIKVFLI